MTSPCLRKVLSSAELSKPWWYGERPERLFIRLSELSNRWHKSFSKDKCRVMLLQKNNLDHACMMFSLELAATTQERHLWTTTERSLKSLAPRTVTAKMSRECWASSGRELGMERTVLSLCKNLASPHLAYWVLFYSLHLKKVLMKLRMLEEKGNYNSQGTEAIKWLTVRD